MQQALVADCRKRDLACGLPHLLTSFWRSRTVAGELIKREIAGRYRGSVLGLFWALIQPMAMLAVYTFVFSVVFRTRWNTSVESRGEFALLLFAGLIVFSFVAECANRAPNLIVENSMYVKKVLFPLDVLAWVLLGSALFHFAMSFSVLLLFQLLLRGAIPWTVVFFPVVVLPLFLMALGVIWFLSSLGVFLRDTAHVIGLGVNMLMFLSPIFYPLELVPERYRWILRLNPLTGIIEEARNVVLNGVVPDWNGIAFLCGSGLLFAWLGFVWFQKTRKGFADVL